MRIEKCGLNVRIKFSLVILFGVLFFSGIATASLPPIEWNQFGGDYRHQNNIPITTSFNLSNYQLHVLNLGSNDGCGLNYYDPQIIRINNSLLWNDNCNYVEILNLSSYNLTASIPSQLEAEFPATDGVHIFIPDGNYPNFSSYDLLGNQIWETNVGDTSYTGGVLKDNYVYVGTEYPVSGYINFNLYKINKSTGVIENSYHENTPNGYYNGPSLVTLDNNSIYSVFDEYRIAKFDYSLNKTATSPTVSEDMYNTALVSDDNNIYGVGVHGVVAFSKSNLSVLWENIYPDTGTSMYWPYVNDGTNRCELSCSAAIDGNNIYFVMQIVRDTAIIRSLNKNTGIENWNYSVNNHGIDANQVIVSDNQLFFYANTGLTPTLINDMLLIFDKNTGTLISNFTFPSSGWDSAPFIDSSGNLYVITGEVDSTGYKTVLYEWPPASPTFAPSGHVFFQDVDGLINPLPNTLVKINDTLYTYTDISGAYSIPNIPNGIYTLNVSHSDFTTNSKTISNATLNNDFVLKYSQGFRFVQLTDVHIGPDPLLCGFNYNITTNTVEHWILTIAEEEICEKSRAKSIDKFENVVNGVLNLPTKPDFVIITGDLVEWNNISQYTDFNMLISKFKDNNIIVYIVPGNHDWREDSVPNLLLTNNNLTNYKNSIGDNDYSSRIFNINQSGYRFIGLDSGHDICNLRNFSCDIGFLLTVPTGSGLSPDQINFTRDNILNGKTIIFMHHPAIDDTCLFISCNVISENRDEFINLASNKNVKLVLTGHTHDSKVFNKDGYSYGNCYDRSGTVSNGNIVSICKILDNVTLFVQTRSATKGDNTHGYLRVDSGIDKNLKNQIKLEDVIMTGKNSIPVNYVYLHSPADLHIIDGSGRHTGLSATGNIENNIPDSYYFEEYKLGNITLPAFALLYNTTLNYSIKIVSNFSRENITSDQSVFNFTIESKTENATTTINYNNVSINRNSIAYLQMNSTQTDYTMQVDLDNDSIIDTTKQPDTIETDYAPIATIISSANGSTWNQGQPVTFNGSGFDQEDGTLNKLTWISDRDAMIGHGNFTTANLSAGVHNITLLVNDSSGQVSTSNIVITIRDTVPPLLNIEYPPDNKIFNKQNVTVRGFAYDDSGILNVTVNGLEAGKENWNAIVSLNEGQNIINVTAMDNNGFSTTANRTVYYNSSLASDTEPSAAITNLTHKTDYDNVNRAWINWTWDNPKDADFSYVMVYLDNIFMGSTSRSYFNITGLSRDTNYTIAIQSVDIVDNINLTDVKDIARTAPKDTTPPTTTLNPSGTLGNNSWYISDVQINLTATDNVCDSVGDSGINKTEYSFDNETWNTYITPFNISKEGIAIFYYHSTDNTGNAESIKIQEIKIDKSFPIISFSGFGTVNLGSAADVIVTVIDNISGIAYRSAPNGVNGLDTSSSGLKTFTVTASDIAGNENSSIYTYTVTQATPSITWSNPADIIYGTALGSTQLDATASVAGSLVYTPPSGAVLSAGMHTLHTDFSPTDIINYTTASADVKINVLKLTPTITWANPADITYGTTLSDTQLNAVVSVPGTLVYTPPSGTVLGIGTQILHVDFMPANATNYTTASKDVSITVIDIPPTVIVDSSCFATIPITLRIAGQGAVGNSVTLEVIQDGKVISSAMINRTASSPNAQEANLSATIDLSKNYSGRLIFDTGADISGGTPVWVIIDGVKTKVTTFNTQKRNPASYHQTLDFALAPLISIVGKELTFSATASDPGSETLTFNWNFRDGGLLINSYPLSHAIAITDTVKHIYSAAGSYNISLNVTDDNGDERSASKMVVIS